jgi:hypothetical protein
MGQRQLPGRALVENNFASFEEGFGQSAWRNFVPFFGGDSVRMGNYEVELDTSAYLCSYACGGGSYTSCGGVGTTANLWKAKALKTVFTMVFGSYFGDWDSQNNFLRAALACGDILTNAWSGRPIWQLWHMGLGEPIGYSTLFTQTINSSLLGLGFGAHSAHIALMGDPTLRLFYPAPPDTLTASFQEGDVRLAWSPAMDAGQGYAIYRKMDVGNWHLLAENLMDTSYTDLCVPAGDYHYMVKSIRLEETGSGSFFNLSLGTPASLRIEENEWFATYFLDADEDGYGDAEQDTTACSALLGYAQNDLDCDDSNPEINPGAEEIPNNGIDEDCDGNDLVRTIRVTSQKPIEVFPNPAEDKIHFRKNTSAPLTFQLTTLHGQILKTGVLTEALILSELEQGMYWLKIHRTDGTLLITEKILIQR